MMDRDGLNTPALTAWSNPSLRRESFAALSVFGALAAGAALLGARATNNRQFWYRRLRKPPFQPPA